MELLEFITRIVNPHVKTDKERYWRTIVNCFLVDRSEQIQLGTLPNYFTQCYGMPPNYDGKLSVLLQEPEFKAICRTKKVYTVIWVYPTEFLKQVLRAPLASLHQNITSNSVNNNIESNLSNPFAVLAQKEKASDSEEIILSNVLNNNNASTIINSANPFARDALEEIGQKDKENPENSDQNYEARIGRLTLEELNCGICFDLLKEAVEGNCCKNIFCLPCIEQNGRKCPNCRKIVEWTANEPIRRLVGKIPVQCEYEECIVWSTVSEIEQHKVNCEFNPENLLVSCQKCQQRIMHRLMDEHLSNTCEMNEVPCRACGSMIVRRDVDEHLSDICEMVLVPCSSCNCRIMRKDLAKHEEQDCEFRRVACVHGCGEHMTYKEYIDSHFNRCSHQPIKCTNQKCSVRVQRRRMADHLQECQHSVLQCQHRARGCEVEYKMTQKSAWHKHVAVCRYMLVECSYGCGTELLKYKIKNHHCGHMPEDCPYCDNEFKKIDLEDHKEECPSRTVECDLCDQTMAYALIEQHLSSRCPKRRVKCSKCGIKVDACNLYRHMSSRCPRRVIECEMCHQDIFAEDMDEHDEEECPERNVRCPKCNFQCSVSSLESHLKERCKYRPVQCNRCNEVLAQYLLASHSNKCPERIVKCSKCRVQVLARLLPAHQSETCSHRPIKCSKCKETVAHCSLSDHQSRQCSERIVKCPKCDGYLYARTLSAHLSHACAYRYVRCGDCDDVLTASELPHHKSHKCTERRVACKCGQRYSARVLGVHQLYDCGFRIVTCSHCPKSVYARDLDAHEEQCPKRLVTCEKCSNVMTLKALESHQCNSGCIIS